MFGSLRCRRCFYNKEQTTACDRGSTVLRLNVHSNATPGAAHVTGPEGHRHLFDTIKNLVLLLWKLLEIEFHCVCVCVCNSRAGACRETVRRGVGGILLIGKRPSALYSCLISLSYSRRTFFEATFLQKKG